MISEYEEVCRLWADDKRCYYGVKLLIGNGDYQLYAPNNICIYSSMSTLNLAETKEEKEMVEAFKHSINARRDIDE